MKLYTLLSRIVSSSTTLTKSKHWFRDSTVQVQTVSSTLSDRQRDSNERLQKDLAEATVSCSGGCQSVEKIYYHNLSYTIQAIPREALFGDVDTMLTATISRTSSRAATAAKTAKPSRRPLLFVPTPQIYYMYCIAVIKLRTATTGKASTT